MAIDPISALGLGAAAISSVRHKNTQLNLEAASKLQPKPARATDRQPQNKQSQITEGNVNRLEVEQTRRRQIERTHDENQAEFRAIKLINDSKPPQVTAEQAAEKVAASDKPTLAQRLQTAKAERDGAENTTAVADRQNEKKLQESATVQTSEKLAEKRGSTALTPAQEQGIETYEKIQSYADATTMSNAATAA